MCVEYYVRIMQSYVCFVNYLMGWLGTPSRFCKCVYPPKSAYPSNASVCASWKTWVFYMICTFPPKAEKHTYTRYFILCIVKCCVPTDLCRHLTLPQLSIISINSKIQKTHTHTYIPTSTISLPSLSLFALICFLLLASTSASTFCRSAFAFVLFAKTASLCFLLVLALVHRYDDLASVGSSGAGRHR